MTSKRNILGAVTELNLFPIAALSGTGATAAAAVDLGAYDGDIALIYSCTAMGGSATPTCTFTVTESDASGGTYTSVSGAGAAFTAAGKSKVVLHSDSLKQFVKVTATL